MALASLALDASADIQGVHRAGAADENEQTLVDLSQMPSPWLTGVIPLEDQKFIRWETQRAVRSNAAFVNIKSLSATEGATFQNGAVLNEVDLAVLALKISQCSIQFLTHHLIALTSSSGSWITGSQAACRSNAGRDVDR